MAFERGKPKGKLEKSSARNNRRGTKIRFKPDPQIFGPRPRSSRRGFKMARSKAYLFGGVEIRWRCDPALLKGIEDVPAEATFHFPGGLKDYLAAAIAGRHAGASRSFYRQCPARPAAHGACRMGGGLDRGCRRLLSSYCNTMPTPDGGTHESGLRTALLRGLKDHAERVGQGKRAAADHSEDVMPGCAAMLSVFMREPEFQGQTKDRLATAEGAAHRREQAIKDPFDHWLSGNPLQANKLLDFVIERADERCAAAQEKDIARKTAVRKLRLPGKLADCTNTHRRLGTVHRRGRQRRRLAPSRRATAHPGDPAAARQDPQRRLRHQGQAGANAAALRPDAGARLRHRRALSRRGSALRQASSS
jgi:topoisomerase-4 subunit B